MPDDDISRIAGGRSAAFDPDPAPGSRLSRDGDIAFDSQFALERDVAADIEYDDAIARTYRIPE